MKFVVHIKEFGGGWSVWLNREGDEFPNETAAYLGAVESDWTFTRLGARWWAFWAARRAAKPSSYTLEVKR